MDQPLVSIIIPIYNSARHLDEAIRSAITQTWPNKEIILVDDGSTDNSLAIAKKYENDRIKAYSQPNKGASAARNKGLQEAKGEYVQFLDGDDLLSANKITDQMALLDGRGDWLSISRTIYFSDKKPLPADPSTHDEEVEYDDDPVKFVINMYYKAAIEKDH